MKAKATLQGIILNIFPAEIIGQNFEKRVVRIREKDNAKPEIWECECHQNDCNLLDRFKTHDLVEIDVEIRGREWINRSSGKSQIFLSLKVLDIRKDGEAKKPT